MSCICICILTVCPHLHPCCSLPTATGFLHPASQTADGTAVILQQVHRVLPAARILLLSIFPRDSWSAAQVNEQSNNLTSAFVDAEGIVQYVDLRQLWVSRPMAEVEAQLPMAHQVDRSLPVSQRAVSRCTVMTVDELRDCMLLRSVSHSHHICTAACLLSV